MIAHIKNRMVLWVLALLILLNVGYLVYNVTQQPNTTAMMISLLSLGLLLGATLVYLLAQDKKAATPTLVKESSHTIMESMQKVFKIVTAEGHFSEIYDYAETRRLFSFIPTTKKALVVIKGKAQLGFDFSKCKWEINENKREVKLVEFPPPEVLSLETDYQYYNIEEQFYNLFSKEDLARIQADGKQQMLQAVEKSHLPAVAADQIQVVLKELLHARDWQLVNAHLITQSPKQITQQSLQG
ncbi:MAG: DUF4230 domain-containing protein [Weeksellaceae bacterium]|nr:DUF4230 domain-containing protein [Weeksellaceae bacterium]